MAGSECVEYRALSLTQNQVDRKWPFRGCCKSGVWIRDIEAKQHQLNIWILIFVLTVTLVDFDLAAKEKKINGDNFSYFKQLKS